MQPALTALAALAQEMAVEPHVVGGTVRDVLLDRRPIDLDVAVSRDALAFARRAADILAGHYVELDDERAVARIVLKPRKAEESPAEHASDPADVGMRAIAVFCDEAPVPPPAEREAISYIDIAQLQGDLAADMSRRDCTIDALAVPLAGASSGLVATARSRDRAWRRTN